MWVIDINDGLNPILADGLYVVVCRADWVWRGAGCCSNQSSNQGAIASEDKPAPDQDNKAMRDAVKGDDGDVSKTARNPGPQAGAPERAQERAQDVEMPDAAGSGGDEKPQEAAEGQEVHADKRELADSATGAGGGEARGTGARTLCLRELDVHKCAIMPPVINAT